MAATTTAKYVKTPARPAKTAPTIERARLLCPKARVAQNAAAAFGIKLPDYDGIRETHKRMILQARSSFDEASNKIAAARRFQIRVGAFVSSAQDAGASYTQKISAAYDLSSKLANVDQDPVVGFDSKVDRARKFAAQIAMQAYALLAAAEGAVNAYREITGNEWMAYVSPTERPSASSRKAPATQIHAFS